MISHQTPNDWLVGVDELRLNAQTICKVTQVRQLAIIKAWDSLPVTKQAGQSTDAAP